MNRQRFGVTASPALLAGVAPAAAVGWLSWTSANLRKVSVSSLPAMAGIGGREMGIE